LLGPNGAGKSTLIKILTGFEKASAGTFSFVDKANLSSGLSMHLGVVPQEEMFYHKFSVEENLSFFGMLYGLSGKKLSDRIDFLIKWLNLEHFRTKEVGYLSGGYRRLVNIACSIIHDPEIVFLDEPTVGLDPKVRKLFWARIKELKQQGKSILITTHYMDEAEALCDRIAILVDGKVLVQGSPFELIRGFGGQTTIIMELETEVDPLIVEGITELVPNSIIKTRGKQIFIAVEERHSIKSAYAVSEFIKRSNVNVISSILREPTLEDVFLNLVGKAEGVRHAQASEVGVEGNQTD